MVTFLKTGLARYRVPDSRHGFKYALTCYVRSAYLYLPTNLDRYPARQNGKYKKTSVRLTVVVMLDCHADVNGTSTKHERLNQTDNDPETEQRSGNDQISKSNENGHSFVVTNHITGESERDSWTLCQLTQLEK